MKKKGFTLVELLAVIAILAILVIIALPNVLKMFNDSKKNSFLTEAKTVYSEVSKKYISESMKGNKLTYVSSEDDTKLDMTGKNLQYCVLLNADGSVKSMKVSNGTWVAELSGNKKITDLKSSDLKKGNLNKLECGIVTTVSFAEDSWATIAKAVRTGQTSNYHVGDEKEVDVGTFGKQMVRISNMSTPDECNQEGFSQSACGFVVEFADVITTHKMNDSGKTTGGWPATSAITFVNNEIYNSLPNDLKSIIINTSVVSGHGPTEAGNFTTTDKLYLLSLREIWGSNVTNLTIDTSYNFTRQLDYYNSINTDGKSFSDKIVKKHNKTIAWWWLRSAHSSDEQQFFIVDPSGECNTNFPNNEPSGEIDSAFENGISPAFRIG